MKIVAVICAYAILGASLTSAQDTVRDRVRALQAVPDVPAVPEGVDEVVALQQGARAPYDGMLLSTDTAIRWTNALRWWPETFRLRLQLMGQIFDEQEQSYQLRLRIVEESYGREIAGLRQDARELADRLARAMDRPWYDTVAFGIGVGAVVVLIIGGLVAGVVLGVR
jgi:hypothetical protein